MRMKPARGVDDLIAALLRTEAALLSPLSPARQAHLADLLGELASALEEDVAAEKISDE
jgi:hypothetical protein